MAKAPSLRKDWSKGTQRTRKLSTVNVPCMLEKCEGTLRGVLRPRRPTEGAEPYTMKVVRAVLNGGREETYGNATRLAPTQLPRFRFPPRLTPRVGLAVAERSCLQCDGGRCASSEYRPEYPWLLSAQNRAIMVGDPLPLYATRSPRLFVGRCGATIDESGVAPAVALLQAG